MANVETANAWQDMGKFKSKKCKKYLGTDVCTLRFSDGVLTLTRKELRRMCGR